MRILSLARILTLAFSKAVDRRYCVPESVVQMPRVVTMFAEDEGDVCREYDLGAQCWTDVQLKQVKRPRTALFLEKEQANGLSGFDSRK